MHALGQKSRLILYLIILFEGYVVLASELLAIRLLVPFVGSGTEVIAIVISAVLLPLALGYHAGAGRYAKSVQQHQPHTGVPFPTVRRILLRNVMIALAIFGTGLSQVFLEIFFGILQQMQVTRLWQTASYAMLFLVVPVFLLAQTVPLVSHYFRGRTLNTHTGRVLFFSTAGSFLGSVFSTLILMNIIGVHGTTIATMGLLTIVGILVLRKTVCPKLFGLCAIFALIAYVNAPSMLASLGVVSNNGYNIISVENINGEEESRLLRVNHAYSSKFSKDPSDRFPYIDYIDRHYIETLPKHEKRRVLIVGAGGFTLGLSNNTHYFDYVDIDPALKDVAETHFLKQKLSSNKHFHPVSARAFLRDVAEKYDLIVVDTYSNAFSIPQECTTVEFTQALKDALKPGGIVVANVIGRPQYDEKFIVRYHNSFKASFPVFQVRSMGEHNPWQRGAGTHHNLLFIYYDTKEAQDNTLYRDALNTYSLDRQ